MRKNKMREILFIGKRIDNGEWVYGYLIKRPSPIQIGNDYSPWYIFSPPKDPDDDGGWYNVDPETVGQYIGTDINGEKGFEGHIVKCRHEWQPKEEDYFYHESETLKKFNEQKIKCAYGKHTDIGGWGGTVYYYYRNYVVEYDKKTGGWRLRNGNVIHEIKVGTLYNRRAEIIGNIHDNPELLKGDPHDRP
jgi:uncharacterized phage protein (TIGR01671 family)